MDLSRPEPEEAKTPLSVMSYGLGIRMAHKPNEALKQSVCMSICENKIFITHIYIYVYVNSEQYMIKLFTMKSSLISCMMERKSSVHNENPFCL